MIPWKKRPFEVANLLNPGFCALLLFHAVQRYQRRSGRGMPYPIIILILPIVLHKSTRNSLPKSPTALFHPWIEKNSHLKIGFPNRVKALLPFTKEAIILGFRAKTFQINTNGEIIVGPSAPSNPSWDSDSEVAICQKTAGLLGSWFSQIQDNSSLYIMWSIQP